MERRKPVLYMHIGYPKTGTSSIQTFCYKNKGLLHQKGICYPEPRAEGLLRKHNAGHIYCCETLGLTNFAFRDWKFVRQLYLDEMRSSNCPKNLLSSEQFLFEHSDTLEFWQQDFSIYGICYFRTLFDYLNSLQKEFIKECLRPDVFTFTEFRNIRILGSLKYLIRGTGGRENWIFKDFDAVRHSGTGLIEDFMQILGVEDLSGFFRGSDENVTPQDALLTFLYQLSFLPLDYPQAYCIRKDVTSLKLPEGKGFRNNFLPPRIYELDDYATWAIKFQGELLQQPDWFEKTLERGRALARIPYQDLPAPLQYEIFDRLSEKSKSILEKFLSVPRAGRTDPFLPAMRDVPQFLPRVLPLYARYVSLLGERLKSRMRQ